MLHDPLLAKMNNPSIQKDQTMETTQSPARAPKAKRRPPARSAKILTVGLSTTAMLGMTTGYAFADLAQKTEEAPVAPVAPVSPAATPQTPASPSVVAPQAASPSASVEKTPAAPAPAQQTPAAPQGAQNAQQQEVVIDVPVAGNGNSSWNNQKSSGSN